MLKQLKSRLDGALQKAFHNSFEKGGGKEHRYFHGVRVARFSEIIARKEKLKINYDSLFLAALFHDIGKIKAITNLGEIDYKSQGNRDHHKVDSDVFMNVLGEDLFGEVGSDIVSKAVSIIRETHSDHLTSMEVSAIKDADELDNFGYLQIWRTFTYDALVNMNFADALTWWIKEGRRSRLELLKKLRFGYTKKIARRGFKRIDLFFRQLEKEHLGIFS